MFFEGKIIKSGKFWAAELPAFCVYTQGKTRKEAFEMLADAVSTLWPEFKFELTWRDESKTEVLLAPADVLEGIGLVLKQNRLNSSLTLKEIANAMGSNYGSSVICYEDGTRQPSVSKFDELLAAIGKRLVITIEDKAS